MIARQLHPWSLTPEEAIALQRELAPKVARRNRLPARVSRIAGTDISGVDAEGKVRAVVVVLTYPALTVVEAASVHETPSFPYVPGLLSFRETPLLLKAFEKLTRAPDLVIVDGQGIAHPRRFGIACHLGLLLDIPAIGCGKSILTGRHGKLGEKKGATAALIDKGETIGAAVRTRDGVTPVYISPGHRVDLPTAVAWALACATQYRLPEPTRLAHQTATALLKGEENRLL